MIEGGERLYEYVNKSIDAVMIFQTQKDSKGKSFVFGKEFERLKKFKYFDDTISWKMKKDTL
jgi:hypothetical protein